MLDNLFLNNIPLFGLFQVMGFLFSLIILFIYSLKYKIEFLNIVFFYFLLLFGGFLFGNIFYRYSYLASLYSGNEYSQSILGSYIFVLLLFFFFRIFKLSKQIKYLDIIFLSFPVFQILGKIGCYFGGCCGSDLAIFIFIPLQFFESFCMLLIFIIITFKQNKIIQYEGLAFLLFTINYSIIRFISEFFRVESTVEILYLRVPQIVSAIILLVTYYFLKTIKSKKD